MYLKISSTDRGTIPRCGSTQLYLKPSMVKVLPVPVWPYAMMVALNPSSVDITACRAVLSYTSSWLLSWSYT